MNRTFVVFILAGVSYGQGPLQITSSDNNQLWLKNNPASEQKQESFLNELPPQPQGKASLIGGTIRNLDPIRDQMTIQAFGGGQHTVLFDERTLVYLNGRKSSLRDLSEGQHIYAETVLDKTDVFARSIHIAMHAFAEESNGQIVSLKGGELIISDALFPQPVKLRLDKETTILNGDQTVTSAALLPGALVNVRFLISSGQEPIARQISILAQPGREFVFFGHVTHLDLHTQLLVLTNPLNNRSYELYCHPTLVPAELREGANVTVTAKFDGAHYAVTAITLQTDANK